MQFEAIWVPRSRTHFREIYSILEGEHVEFAVTDIDPASVDELEAMDAATRVIRFAVERDGQSFSCYFTEIGLLVLEADVAYDTTELRRLAKDIYTTLAEQRWVVLAQQIRHDLVPWGEASVELDEFEIGPIFDAVCTDYLSDCIRKSRTYDVETDNEKITDLLQRIKQAETCYQYTHDVYGFERPALRQHLRYTRDLIEMLYQNVTIQTDRNRQEQLHRIEMIALGISGLLIVLSLFQFLYNVGYL